jgi:uncharacterized protein (TIGR03435 family)
MGCHGADGQSGDPAPEQTCVATAVSFEWITAFANDIPFDRMDALISGGSEWFNISRYEVKAEAGRPATLAELKQMLQTLLADRLKLRFHRVTRVTPGYELVVAEAGTRLEAAKDKDHGAWNVLHQSDALTVYHGRLPDLAHPLPLNWAVQ